MSKLGRYRGGHAGRGSRVETQGGGPGAGVREEQSRGLRGRHGETVERSEGGGWQLVRGGKMVVPW